MKKIFFAALAASLCFFACSEQPDESQSLIETSEVEGIVVDRTPSEVILLTEQSDIISILIPEEDADTFPDLCPNDEISLICELHNNGDEGTDFVAREVSHKKFSTGHLVDTWLSDGKGFTLNDDHTAKSVGTDSIKVRRWSIDNNGCLSLDIKEILPDGKVNNGPVDYIIQTLNDSSLVLLNVKTREQQWILSNREEQE